MEGGPPGFPRDSSCPAVLWILPAAVFFRLRDSHALRWAFPCPSARFRQCVMQSATPDIFLYPVWPSSRSLATTWEISVDFFSSPYLDVSVQAVPPVYLWIQYTVTEYCSAGLLHSEIHGSVPICGSPWLIAACRVLLRLLMPRHSPCALLSLTFFENCLIMLRFSKLNCFNFANDESDFVVLPSHFFNDWSHFTLLRILSFSLFSFQDTNKDSRGFYPAGGLKWTRTTDLTIISRVL